MIEIQENYSLKNHNTFGFDVKTRWYYSYSETTELIELIKGGVTKTGPLLILGGGSNLLLASDFQGTVLHSAILGIDIIDESGDDVIVAVGAGVEWDSLVSWSVENGLGGLENLSLIPGSVGASPVQNIGAYGVELKDVFFKAEGVYIESGEVFTISAQGCEFGYRYSVFKGPLKNKAIITRVLFRLSRKPLFKLDYGTVRDEVKRMGGSSLKNIRNAIVKIRSSKLPDTTVFGNAGSFFKNPLIPGSQLSLLKIKFPDIPFYEAEPAEMVKVPAGWLIEKAGWKGKSIGKAGVHHQQALVLVNLGGANGQDVLNLAQKIESDVKQLFNIDLEREVNVVGL